jgi:hypothetical protein
MAPGPQTQDRFLLYPHNTISNGRPRTVHLPSRAFMEQLLQREQGDARGISRPTSLSNARSRCRSVQSTPPATRSRTLLRPSSSATRADPSTLQRGMSAGVQDGVSPWSMHVTTRVPQLNGGALAVPGLELSGVTAVRLYIRPWSLGACEVPDRCAAWLCNGLDMLSSTRCWLRRLNWRPQGSCTKRKDACYTAKQLVHKSRGTMLTV